MSLDFKRISLLGFQKEIQHIIYLSYKQIEGAYRGAAIAPMTRASVLSDSMSSLNNSQMKHGGLIII